MLASRPISPDGDRTALAAAPFRMGMGPGQRRRRKSKSGTVQDYLVQRILKGQLPGDRKLPSEASLERRLNVSRVTVRAAINALRDAGLVYSFQGAGHFARPVRIPIDPARFAPLAAVFAGFGETMLRHAANEMPALGRAEAQQLGVPSEEEGVRMGCLVCLGGVPLCAEMLILDESFAGAVATLWKDGMLGQAAAGDPVAGFAAQEFADHVFAPDCIAAQLGLDCGSAVMRQSLVLRSHAGVFAALVQRYIHPDLVAVPATGRRSR